MEILEKIQILDRLKREIAELKEEAEGMGVRVSVHCECFLSDEIFKLCFLHENTDEPTYTTRRIDLWELLGDNGFNLKETLRAFREILKNFSMVLAVSKRVENA